jgi:hypothetical protein
MLRKGFFEKKHVPKDGDFLFSFDYREEKVSFCSSFSFVSFLLFLCFVAFFFFAHSYTLSKAIKEFFDEFGFVVVRDVLTAEECEKTVDELWQVHSAMSGGRIKRDDSSTWENEVTFDVFL